MTISHLLKQLFRRRQPSKVGGYIDGMSTIDKLVEEEMLYVDIARPYVVLSVRMHMAYMDDEEKLSRWPYRMFLRWGLVERDRRYRALMEHLLAYINFHRARFKQPIHHLDQPLRFHVMSLDLSKPLLLGVYQSGVVEFKLCEDIEDRLEIWNKKQQEQKTI